jgi:branched-chain amino acid transport system permease protein
MAQWINQLLIGLALAGPVLLMAVALSTVISASGVLNVTVGAVFAATGIVGVAAVDAGGGLPLFVVVCLAMPVILYLALELIVLRPQRHRRSGDDGEIGAFAATLGASIVITAVAAQITHANISTLPPSFVRLDKVWTIGSIQLSLKTVVLFGVSVLLALGWGLVLKRTSLGKLCRAVATNAYLARTLGVRPDRVIARVWVISGLLTGVATILLVLSGRSVGAESGATYLLVPFAAVVAGGMGSILGASLASIFFGLAQAVVANLTSQPGIQDAVVFGLLFVLLLLRPEGIVRAHTGVRAY